VREAKLVKEQARGLHSFHGWDLSAELDEICARMARIDNECTAEAKKLSMLVMGISNALVDLGKLPI
jgi:hypothetical protein